MGTESDTRIRNITAVLGPTNTGKTHLAIERMLGHESGMIGLPLRLLAREVYDKVAARVGPANVALITGEEKIKPESARYWVCTVEAMPRDITVDFLAIDEVQLAADPERGHVFTDRLLHARGRSETLLLGAGTMRDAIADLVPGANFITRPRLSKLTYAGQKKLTRLPKRSAIVAFSAAEVYAVAELIRRQQGGAAVVIGALSPRTRNAQVALYQSGDVDYIVATDAIGMGLNLDLDHVALSALRKFDGQNHRNLTPGEIAQIAGRAGRHMNDGTFGVTGGAEPMDADLIERLENHNFEPIRTLQWRNRVMDFSTLFALRESLREIPSMARLTRARMADDVAALETIASDTELADFANDRASVELLWGVCQIPDYRKISASNHAELVGTLYKSLRTGDERIPEDWFAKQVAFSDRTDGDIDTLSNRLAHIRTWTFVANRANWLKDPAHWQARTREIEDQLSDALHERLTQRFVDKRTSALMKGMRDKDELTADIAEDGAINVENHYVGRLKGFRFIADAEASEGVNQKAARSAAAQVVSRELGMRTRRVVAAKADAFKLTRKGQLLWRNEEIAEVVAGEDPLKPTFNLLVDDTISAADREKLQTRLEGWIVEMTNDKLKALVDLAKAEDVTGLAKGIAFRLRENFGILKRDTVAEEIKSLDQPARAQLRKYGVRFGAFNIFFPPLLKPAAADLALSLWCIKNASANGLTKDTLPEPPRAGLTSVSADPAISDVYYRAAGYHLCGPRAVRLDILERLADLIRPLLAWRQNKEAGATAQTPPRGSTGEGGFTVLPEMMSILGCSPDELSAVLKSLGFLNERRVVKPAAPVVLAAHAASVADGATADGSPEVEAAPAAEADAGEMVEVVVATVPAAEAADVVVADQPVVAAEAVDAALVAGAPAATVADEPKYEDVWRPRRPHHHGRGERTAREPRPAGEGNRDRSRYRKPVTSDATAGEAAGAAAAVAPEGVGGAPRRDGERQGDRRPDRDRTGRNDRNRQGGDRRPADRGGAPARAADGGKPVEGGSAAGPPRGRDGDRRNDSRGDRGNDRPRGNRDRDRDDKRGPKVISASPSKKSADPDSPFAALSALREQLAGKGKEKNSG
ncbi:MAG: helicase-related protein [Hyphomicrobiaceae bacterium]